MRQNSALIFAAIVIGISVMSLRVPASADDNRAEGDAAAQVEDTADDTDTSRPTVEPRRGDPVVLEREADGHFYTDATINGATIRFMVDTGASSVALTQEDARRAGMFFLANDFNQVGSGAGGDIALRAVTFDRVAVGDIEARDVRGVVIGGDGDMSLLGQSFLKTLGGVTIEGDTMVLRPA